MSTLGWLATVPSSVCVIMATLIEAIAEVNNVNLEFERWQYTLLMLAFLVVTIAFSTWVAKAVPRSETLSLFRHLE